MSNKLKPIILISIIFLCLAFLSGPAAAATELDPDYVQEDIPNYIPTPEDLGVKPVWFWPSVVLLFLLIVVIIAVWAWKKYQKQN
ncbi:hypothetical protein [Methanimicrococcus blatticola]|uniref:Uncharacterized protein n=1 Tax=Methanimicrococcus blatticola TaxID=91560 RepID=A0A484F4S7_9EURY|nr:hypothetical protein [Methanimicrococcus blatticola]MBZ3936203.1 hypothetical protein [Methanimicrococcus blatticola]MCC2508446.1 hypothetical protein [Methanimicrococcus blatticola]TDQ70101.1 hypothetical protein C7391_0438 [Methanimicrococcus blatticola]